MSSRTERPAKEIEEGSADVFDTPSNGGGEAYEKLIEKADQLEEGLASEKDERREERFYWILSVALLLNVLFAKFLQNNVAFITLFVIQLFFLAAVARKLGVDWVVEATDRSAKWVSDQIGRLFKGD